METFNALLKLKWTYTRHASIQMETYKRHAPVQMETFIPHAPIHMEIPKPRAAVHIENSDYIRPSPCQVTCSKNLLASAFQILQNKARNLWLSCTTDHQTNETNHNIVRFFLFLYIILIYKTVRKERCVLRQKGEGKEKRKKITDPGGQDERRQQ